MAFGGKPVQPLCSALARSASTQNNVEEPQLRRAGVALRPVEPKARPACGATCLAGGETWYLRVIAVFLKWAEAMTSRIVSPEGRSENPREASGVRSTCFASYSQCCCSRASWHGMLRPVPRTHPAARTAAAVKVVPRGRIAHQPRVAHSCNGLAIRTDGQGTWLTTSPPCVPGVLMTRPTCSGKTLVLQKRRTNLKENSAGT